VPKTRRRSVHQEQKRKWLGDVLPIKKSPVKKPRQDNVSAQAKKDEKEKAEKKCGHVSLYLLSNLLRQSTGLLP
jgi:hypothetical protein